MNKTMIKVKAGYSIDTPKVRRGEIEGFSGESRKRMFDMIHTIDEDAQPVPLFASLTYGQVWPSERDAYDHLKLLVRRLDTFHGRKVGVVWRGDLQKRGAPHFHLLLFCPFTPMDWLNQNWGAVIGPQYWDWSQGNPLPPMTDVQAIRSWRGVKSYVGHYLARTNESDKRTAPPPPPGGTEGAEGESPSFSLTLPHIREKEHPQYKGRAWGVLNKGAIIWDSLQDMGTVKGDVVQGFVQVLSSLGGLDAKRNGKGGVTLYVGPHMASIKDAARQLWEETQREQADATAAPAPVRTPRATVHADGGSLPISGSKSAGTPQATPDGAHTIGASTGQGKRLVERGRMVLAQGAWDFALGATGKA